MQTVKSITLVDHPDLLAPRKEWEAFRRELEAMGSAYQDPGLQAAWGTFRAWERAQKTRKPPRA